MRPAEVFHAEHTRRNRVAQALKVSGDDIETGGQMVADVLEEDERRSAFFDDSSDVRPEILLAVVSPPAPSDRERLTRVPRQQDIHDSTPAVAVEVGKVRPDRRSIHPLAFHPRHERGCAKGFPLNVTYGSKVHAELCAGELDAEVEASDTRTTGQGT
jgi:hypothetical protein